MIKNDNLVIAISEDNPIKDYCQINQPIIVLYCINQPTNIITALLFKHIKTLSFCSTHITQNTTN